MHKNKTLSLMVSKSEVKHKNQLIQQNYMVCKLPAFHFPFLYPITEKTGNVVWGKSSELGHQESWILVLAHTDQVLLWARTSTSLALVSLYVKREDR